MKLESLSQIRKELEATEPSAEETFWLYARALSLDMSGKLSPLVKAHLPVLKRMAQPFMDEQERKWLYAPTVMAGPK